jgi:3,4-dihydroxy 2-butanone 4-phosphate synthase/GTP cyclohydrolase II
MTKQKRKKLVGTSRKKVRPAKSSKPAAVYLAARAALPSRFGEFEVLGFEGKTAADTAVALVQRSPGASDDEIPVLRIHSQCLTGDVLASERCDCRAQLEYSLEKIAAAPYGILLYLPQEGRGIGLINKLKAYELQDAGLDTVQANRKLGFAADSRDYSFSAQILKLLNVDRVRLLSNNPDKVRQLEKAGITIAERLPCQPKTSHRSRSYLATKKNKLGHLLEGF